MFQEFLAAFCLFTPPQGWEMASPKASSKSVICGFIDRSQAGFCPSIHLTREEISCSMDHYLDVVYKNAKAKKQHWRKIGEVATQSGKAYLIAIELDNPFGKITLMQAILPGDGEVHILTGGTLKRDLLKYASLFHKSFQSMHLASDPPVKPLLGKKGVRT